VFSFLQVSQSEPCKHCFSALKFPHTIIILSFLIDPIIFCEKYQSRDCVYRCIDFLSCATFADFTELSISITMIYAATSHRLQFLVRTTRMTGVTEKLPRCYGGLYITLSMRFASRHNKSGFLYVSLKPTGGMT
jgi:hypothetical protein